MLTTQQVARGMIEALCRWQAQVFVSRVGCMPAEPYSKTFLRKHVGEDFLEYFGDDDARYIEHVVGNWFDDSDCYDGRWNYIEGRLGKPIITRSRILDMASGCGTFVLCGLRKGYDVWGIEPEPWKLEFIRLKVQDSNYPEQWIQRFVKGVGENLPFDNESFDFVTTYQTLEHVQNVPNCLSEMERVLCRGGTLYLRAPDYNSFFEDHYRVPFLPQMDRRLAKFYLRAIGKPLKGLDSIQYTTNQMVKQHMVAFGTHLRINDVNREQLLERDFRIATKLAFLPRAGWLTRLLNTALEMQLQIARVGRSQNTIHLWITKGKPDNQGHIQVRVGC